MAKNKKGSKPIDVSTPLPALTTIESIRDNLADIFPESFPNRSILVGPMAARVIYVFLYGGFVEGSERYLRPSHVYLFTEEQAVKTSKEERIAWLVSSRKPGFRPLGKRWYADTSREPIRDDLMRNQLLRLGIMKKRNPERHAVTSSTPINYLAADFAALFDPKLTSQEFVEKADRWRKKHLDQATLQRMALRAHGAQAKGNDILIDMPDGTRIRVSSGPSNEIVKALIEEFGKRHMDEPVVLWVSASDKKSYPQFVETAASVGLRFDLNAELPDLILADMTDPVKFFMCEVVATDGAVTEMRKQALLGLVRASRVPEECVEFLSAFEDREAVAFRKNFSQLALNTLVWFCTEPDLLVILNAKNKALLSTDD
ncbi:hypothetical protein BAE30_07015 [Acidithiobacillus caldus]|nr:hypothetical protein BAE30_07015 [Acidithiobacillus caldus]